MTHLGWIIAPAFVAACASSSPQVEVEPEGTSRLIPRRDPRAPDFRARALVPAGEMYQLGPLGRPVVLAFAAAWCAPCVAELPELVRLAAKWKPRGVDVVIVDLDLRPEGQAPLVAAARGSSLWVLDDSDQTIANLYGVEELPSTLILDADRHMRFLRTGADPSTLRALEAALEELL